MGRNTQTRARNALVFGGCASACLWLLVIVALL